MMRKVFYCKSFVFSLFDEKMEDCRSPMLPEFGDWKIPEARESKSSLQS